MKISILLLLLSFLQSSCASEPITIPINDWVEYEDRFDKNKVHPDLLGNIQKCVSSLDKIFDRHPKNKLKILFYDNRDKYTEALTKYYGFSPEQAKQYIFLLPKPHNGYLISSPSARSPVLCHEIVHLYLEEYADRETRAKATWFEEGLAEYYPFTILGNYTIMRRPVPDIDTLKKEVLALMKTKLTSDDVLIRSNWNKFRTQDVYSSVLIYSISNLMIDFFVKKYGNETLLKLIKKVGEAEFDIVFFEVTHNSEKQFFDEFIETIKI